MKIVTLAAALAASAAFAAGMEVSLAPSGEKGLYLPGETPTLTLAVTNGTGAAAEMVVDISVTDYFGDKVRSWKETFPVAAGGSAVKPIPFAWLEKMGYYCATAKWSGGGSSGVVEGALVKTGSLPEKPDPLFGISGFAPNDGETFSRLGVGTKAVSLNWRPLEGKDGKLNAEKSLASIRALKEKGIKVIGHTEVPPRKSATPTRYLKAKSGPKDDPFADPEKFLADYERFAFELVSAFKDEIREWAAVNEINLTANAAPYMRQMYIKCVKAFSRGMRRADPKATLVAIGCSGADGRSNPRYPFLRGILPSIVESIDGFGIDQYNAGQMYGRGYANLNSEQAEIRDIMLAAVRIAKANGKRLVSIDEKGPSIVRATPLSSPLGRTMADIVARDFILLKTVPEVGHWLYFRPFNWNPKSVVDYGMWENANPRQTVAAYSSTARLMAGAEFVKNVAVHSDIPAWMFRKAGRFFATVWYNGQDPLAFKLPAGAAVEAKDMHGNAVEIGGGAVTLGPSPTYLFALTEEALEKALKGASFDVPDMDAVMDVAPGAQWALSVRNIGARQITVDVSRRAVEPIRLAADETKTVLLPAEAGAEDVLLKSSSGRTLKVSAPPPPHRVRRVSGFDGLSGSEEIRLDDPMRQAPGYADLKSNGLYTGTDDLSVGARLGYDAGNLYLEFTVKDDIHLNRSTPARVYVGDCVQFALDTLKDGRARLLKGQRGFGDGDYNIVLGLVDETPVAWCYGAAAVNRERMAGKPMAAPEIVRDEASKTTRYRFAIPFADLAPIRPEKGQVFGFSFLAFDMDPKEGLYRIEATQGLADPPNPAYYLSFVFD